MPDYPRHMVTAPPALLGLDPFYAKYADAEGIPVTGSAKVPDTAILAARHRHVHAGATPRRTR